jgi:threonine aldolase
MQGLGAEAGRPTPEQIEEVDELGPGSVVVLENTHRSSGGRIWPLEAFGAVVEAARSRGAAVHLDGARLFNASVAAGIEPSAWGALADTVTICFSKGLGCPFGAVLAGRPRRSSRRGRGSSSSAARSGSRASRPPQCSTALDNHVERLADDHARAKRLAEGIGIYPASVETNFVSIPDEPGLRERLFERGVGVGGPSPRLAACRHASRRR